MYTCANASHGVNCKTLITFSARSSSFKVAVFTVRRWSTFYKQGYQLLESVSCETTVSYVIIDARRIFCKGGGGKPKRGHR